MERKRAQVWNIIFSGVLGQMVCTFYLDTSQATFPLDILLMLIRSLKKLRLQLFKRTLYLYITKRGIISPGIHQQP